jgi:hypothetical protein
MGSNKNREQFSDAATKRPSAEHERDKMSQSDKFKCLKDL